MANQFLALSMFIMLLSFFIVLSTMSDFEEERAKPVLSSISNVFSSKPVITQVAPSTVQTEQQSLRKGDVVDRLEGLFTSQISGVKTQKNRLGTKITIQMPVPEFEKNILNAGEGGNNFRQTLVSVLQTQMGTPYRMDIVLGVGKNPADLENRDPRRSLASIRKVAAFTRVLEAAGMPRKMLSAGLGAGSRKYVTLYFERYRPLDLRSISPVGAGEGGGL